MPKTLLLADDSVTIQKVVGISFASEDIAIVTVDNGRDAVTKAREVRPDIILADVVMPAMSGYEVCEAIKADPALSHIPVLLLTGTFEAFDEARAAAAGAAGHVAKPFEAQTLVERVRQLLAAVSAPRPTPSAPRAAAPPPVPAAPRPASSSRNDAEAFDFFSDPPSGSADASDSPSLELDEPDAAFAFGDDDLAGAIQEPASAPPLRPGSQRLDATVAILPDPPTAEEEPLDFSFESDDADPFEAPLDPSDLVQTTLLDPSSAADFDVSSSDLSAEIASLVGPATQVLMDSAEDADSAPSGLDITEPEERARPMASRHADPVMDRLVARAASPSPAPASPARPFGVETEPEVETDPTWTPARESAPRFTPPAQRGDWPPAPVPEARPLVAEPMDDDDAPAAFEAEPFEAEALDDDPFGGALAADEPIAEAEPLDDDPREGAGAPAHDARMSLSPVMREEIQATLEKIAWDAFGQVTEKIVRQAIERIEQVAWDVVPKLAETLIQEEIRRLKGDADD